MHRRTIMICALAMIAAALWLGNTSLTSSRAPGAPMLLAHRGVPQDFDRAGITGDSCTAERMRLPRHSYLENTLPAIEAAFGFGADIVEIDIHPTADGHLAVFHDWTLDCRTDGTGRTRDRTLAELQALDVGYGYTADGGASFPFRGTGVGLMPSLAEVMARFPDRRFLIDIKSNDVEDGAMLANILAPLPEAERARFMVHGGERPVDHVATALPGIRTIHRPALRPCLMRYVALGWSGTVPDACRNRIVLVPLNVGPWLWGWPNRFLDRMEAAGSEVFLLAPLRRGQAFSEGIDDPALLERLPAGWSGGIWTDAIDLIGPALARPARD